MSSGFVRQTTSSTPPSSASNAVPVSQSRNRLRLSNQNQQPDNRSLYEILQENKAKKQAEFEQSVAERNQLHRLDDDEIAFLEGVKERERRRESEVRDEVERGLQEFRELRKAKQLPNKTERKNRGPSPSSVKSMKDKESGSEVMRSDATGGSISAVGIDLEMLKSRFKPASTATKEAEQAQNKKRQLDADEITRKGSDKKAAKNLDKLLTRRKDGNRLGKSLSTSIVKRTT
ncbi:N-terminal domain of NEFA-interacting nuclear protein NIP30-domain-containing protein [Lipomyces kononenkoae]|uniref:N-terminal domain of NEFA-interacting nuclear protein NIP30-domain-containing protein n=1 Tax=Lipomyces kononenkoae TaxID=34357 RepID=A0ACC3T6X2_LIPKO